MASPATPQPEATPQPNQAGASPSGPQANPLQEAIAQLIQVVDTIAKQNPLVQGEFTQVHQQLVQAMQKTMMANKPQPEQAPTPQPQP